ncbi:MAG: MYG1 family protein [bacterium]|nr:MYG1 family protein [bacterium]
MKDSKKMIVTHDGGFHADDAFAVAALLLHLKGNATIVRSRDPKIIASGDFVVDVGGEYDAARNRFDHHQPGGAGSRENTIPYAAFGLVWKTFGAAISGSAEIAARVDAKLVQPIDAADNGVSLGNYEGAPAFPYVIQNAVFAFEPTWNEKQLSLDAGFEEARKFASAILEREIAHARDAALGEALVRAAYENAADKRIIVLDEKYDWGDILGEKAEPFFVITPDRGPSGNWRAHAVRAGRNSFKSRLSFPKEWAGKRDNELADVSGVADAVFCHNKLFTVAARSLEGAIALAKRALT